MFSQLFRDVASTLKTTAFQRIPDLVISGATEVMRQADKGRIRTAAFSTLGEGAMNKIFEAVVRTATSECQ